MNRTILTEQQIVDIAKHKGTFSFKASPYGRKPDKEHQKICKRLELQGVLRFNGAGRGSICYAFIAFPGCPKAAETARRRKKGEIGPRYNAERVVALVEKNGKVTARLKPKTRRERSLANQCQELVKKGVLEQTRKGDGEVVYRKKSDVVVIGKAPPE